MKKRKNGQSLFLSVAVPMKALISIVTILMLSTGLCVFAFLANYVDRVNEEFHNSFDRYADSFAETIDAKISDYHMTMGQIGLNDQIRQYIFQQGYTRFQVFDVQRELTTLIQELTFYAWQGEDVYEHYLYTYLPSDGRYFRDIDSVKQQPWAAPFSDPRHLFDHFYEYSPVTKSYHLTLVSAIDEFSASSSAGSAKRCYQVLSMDVDKLFRSSLASRSDLNPAVFVFDKATGQAVYQSEGAMLPVAKQSYSQFTQEAKAFQMMGGGKACVVRTLDRIGSAVVFVFDVPLLNQMGNSAELSIAGVSILIFVAVFSFLAVFYVIFYRRIRAINFKMDYFSDTGEEAPIVLAGNDEAAHIDQHLTKMQQRIKTLIQENYEVRLETMNTQNEALLACINPHFLYNTLNSISSMAAIEGADDTVRMIEAMGDMFRYSANLTERYVTVQKELENVKDYLFIQGIRYQNQFAYQIDIPLSLRGRSMPKLILQPVVENVFKHAYHQKNGKLLLRITAYEKHGNLYIEVYDDGVGISAQRLHQLTERINAPISRDRQSDGNIGLKNVHRRIQLSYGAEYGVRVFSRLGEYTSVVLEMGKEEKKFV